jgi:hypothetical protein
LNGQPSFMVPSLQFVFPGMLMPDAPPDMISGLGKNDQLLNVVPSQNLVLVRMGDPAYTSQSVAISFNNEIWQRINLLPCTTGVNDPVQIEGLKVFPNPAGDALTVQLPAGAPTNELDLRDATGRAVPVRWTGSGLDLSGLQAGFYTLRLRGDAATALRFVKQ